jgi:hypothetical protein
MVRCERCGSRYSAMYAATFENCPRCQVRDRTAAPLTFKAFNLPDSAKREDVEPPPPQDERRVAAL